MAKKSILTIEALAPERETIDYAGKTYELKHFEELDARELAQIAKLGLRYEAINTREDMTDEDVEEMNVITSAMTGLYTTMPEDIIAQLTYGAKVRIVTVFTQVSGLDEEAPTETESPQTTGN